MEQVSWSQACLSYTSFWTPKGDGPKRLPLYVCLYVTVILRKLHLDSLIFGMKVGEYNWRKVTKPVFRLKFIVSQIWAF